MSLRYSNRWTKLIRRSRTGTYRGSVLKLLDRARAAAASCCGTASGSSTGIICRSTSSRPTRGTSRSMNVTASRSQGPHKLGPVRRCTRCFDPRGRFALGRLPFVSPVEFGVAPRCHGLGHTRVARRWLAPTSTLGLPRSRVFEGLGAGPRPCDPGIPPAG